MPPAKAKPREIGKSLLRAKKQDVQVVRDRYQTSLDAQRDLLQNAPRPAENPKLKSIWETSNMDEFLSIADEREAGYMAERNVRVVVGGNVHVVTKDKRIVPKAEDDMTDWFKLNEKLAIPRRPKWEYDTNPEELQAREKADFLEWRRGLVKAEEMNKVTMTPYEKNLDVWRQLWRVLEKSDIVLQILDSRNPQSFRCPDLERQIASMKNAFGKKKKMILLLNKADLLTDHQRQVWAEFFEAKGIDFLFFSAKAKEAINGNVDKEVDVISKPLLEASDEEASDDVEDEDAAVAKHIRNKKEKRRGASKKLKGAPIKCSNPYEIQALKQERKVQLNMPKAPKAPEPQTAEEIARDERLQKLKSKKVSSWDVVDAESLLDRMALLRESMGFEPTVVTSGENVHAETNKPLMVGMVGYPNVGKSSTINTIMGCKKVVVSATPGKTKHFQTLVIPGERRLMLCDCPGLVFPSFAATKESMVCDGILPIDTVRDYVTPIAVVCERIPRIILEAAFRISLSKDDDLDECQSIADRLLSVTARRRGYMTEHDKPNRYRSAKDILRMYVDGGLVYVHAPRNYVEQLPEELRGTDVDPDYIAAKEKAAEEEDHEGSWEEADEDGAWEDISEAGDARAISDRSSNEDEDSEGVMRVERMPLFFSRRRGPITNSEKFNFYSNYAIAIPLIESYRLKKAQAKRKGRTNPQLEDDGYFVEVTEDGHKQLLIDSDDDIEELPTSNNRGGPTNAASTKRRVPGMVTGDDSANEGGFGARQTKQQSKRQQRRQAKKDGVALPVNPTKKTMQVGAGF